MTLSDSDVARAYAATAAKTVAEGPMLLVALYDRLALDVELAKQYLAEREYERVDAALQHAQKIVIVLNSGLQPDGFVGGRELRRLYNTLVDLLVKANLYKDAGALSHCEAIIAPLHAAWTEAVAREMARVEAGGGRGVD